MAPQPLYKHTPIDNSPVYYEIVGSFIYRVGVEPESKIHITDESIKPENTKLFQYIVIGDATCIEGLKAPYDEENTSQIMKIEFVEGDENFLSFWMGNSNKDHFTPKSPEYAEFQKN